jgi:hypothetical protein
MSARGTVGHLRPPARMVAPVEDVTEQQPPQGLEEFHRYVERFFSEITPPLIDETTGGSLTRAKA